MSSSLQADIDPPSRCNCARIRRAARSITRYYDACLAPSGIGTNQYTILGYLKHRGPMRIAALGNLLAMDPATVGHNLRPLERDGFLTIVPDESDRRARLISITEDGLAKVAETHERWMAAQRNFEEAFGQEEARALRHMLDAVADQRLKV